MSHQLVEIPPIGLQPDTCVAENDGMRSRSAMAKASGQYCSAIPAEISRLTFDFPSDLMANLAESTAELAQFDASGGLTTSSGAPAFGPMSSILLRTESASSSQIENLTVGARQLSLAQLQEASSPNARSVYRNVRAMEAAIALGDEMSSETILALHRELFADDEVSQLFAGKFRTQLVWVGSSPVSPLRASYVTPQPEEITHYIEDLLAFMRRIDVPLLAQVAITHAQFETIHPFVDGNGRTGRAIVHAMLRAGGLNRSLTVPLSAGLLRETGRYFEALTAFREGNAYAIIDQFCDAARFGTRTGKALAESLENQVAFARSNLSGVRSDAVAWKILPILVSNPVINAELIKRQLKISDNSAQRGIRTLVEREILRETTGRSRGRLWQHDGILRVLDDYAVGIRRR